MATPSFTTEKHREREISEGVGAVVIEGDAHQLGVEVIHGHLAAEGAGGGERGWGGDDVTVAIVDEEDDKSVGEVERREEGGRVGHVDSLATRV
ncbi:hypothetical protein RIF29_40429 [Crotalaria pallida]|uniref:Uncharacterized protein n=1 Tax=Crotalaria pallida TaxID=3830 RepID=A0AAN9HRP3_CROPI